MKAEDYERRFERKLAKLIGASLVGRDGDVCTFKEEGIMTTNRGLVVRIGNQEFQLTIVRSK